MKKEMLNKKIFSQEIIALIRSSLDDASIAEQLRNYHTNDIVWALKELKSEERIKLYDILETEWFSDIVTFTDEPKQCDSEDYAKLAGLAAEEDLKETTADSMKKRLPWLVVLLFLGMGVSTVVGAFENVVAVLPIVICFQSLILDMAGNVGTQSLAVTIRVLMDEDLSAKDKASLVLKEVKVGFCNGLLLGIITLIFLCVYIHLFKGYEIAAAFLIACCVGISLLLAMVISGLVGTLIPLFFYKINIDPAVASGPLITTVNDLVAVITYYGLSWLILIQAMHII